VLTVRLYAERKGWTLDRIETRVTRDAGEGKINSIELELLLGGDLSEEQRQRLAEIASHAARFTAPSPRGSPSPSARIAPHPVLSPEGRGGRL
jgi:putative redox protein